MQFALHKHVLKKGFYKQTLAVLGIPVRASNAWSCWGAWLPLHWDNIGMSSLLVTWLAPSWKEVFMVSAFLTEWLFGHDLLTGWLQVTENFFGSWCETFWSDMFGASNHRPVFIFIEKEQTRETWPHGLYFSSTQQQSSESNDRKMFPVFFTKEHKKIIRF